MVRCEFMRDLLRVLHLCQLEVNQMVEVIPLMATLDWANGRVRPHGAIGTVASHQLSAWHTTYCCSRRVVGAVL